MNNKDFLIRSIIVTTSILIIVFFLFSPINKILRVVDTTIYRLEKLDRKIGDQSIQHYLLGKIEFESKKEGLKKEDQLRIINSLNIIIERDIKPIINGIKY
jgi:hypothetical protein|tara:strand:+ start:973 stop:1275 length:303 start_codon:yes stop_codon:yes gene_type:complete